MGKITYENKEYLNENANIPAMRKVSDTDMNEIKNIVNGNDDNVGDLMALNTTNKASVVQAINEIVDGIDSLFSVDVSNVVTSLSLNAKAFTSVQAVSIVKEGYFPLGIVGYSTTGNNHQWVNPIILQLINETEGGASIQYRLINMNDSVAATITLNVKILWKKIL